MKLSLPHGTLWMLLYIFALAAIMLAARGLKTDMTTAQIVLLRAAGTLVILLVLMIRLGPAMTKTKRPGIHALRSVIHILGQAGIIYAVIKIPLADLTAMEFIVPALTAIAAIVMVGEKVSGARWAGMAVSFIGVLFIVRPGFAEFHPALFAAFGGMVCYAIANTMTKILNRTEDAITISFYMALFQTGFALPFAVTVWVMPEGVNWSWVLLISVAGVISHYSMARATALADLSYLFPLDFLRLPLLALIAWLIWGETFSPWTAVGAAIIVASTWYSVRREAKAS